MALIFPTFQSDYNQSNTHQDANQDRVPGQAGHCLGGGEDAALKLFINILSFLVPAWPEQPAAE